MNPASVFLIEELYQKV